METRPKGFSDTTQPPVAIPLLSSHHGNRDISFDLRESRIVTCCMFLSSLILIIYHFFRSVTIPRHVFFFS